MRVLPSGLLPILLLGMSAWGTPQDGTGKGAAPKDPGKAARSKLFREKMLDHFNLGITAPFEWIAETRDKNGCRWDFKITYLTGAAAVPEKPYWLQYGNSPQKFVADARKGGVIPWFTFYALAASAPARYKPGPAQATPVNAKVANTMKEYFGLFKVFVEGCAKETPWPVMAQIEPDEWCHLLQSGGMDPAKVDIKVGSSGMEELKGLPDNLLGYAAALKRLRDLYAPTNVLLGCNPSGWDYGGSMSGQKMGQIMKQVAGDWDFAVFETGDRDKGMLGQNPPYGTSITITGNLENHLKWITDFNAVSNLYVFVWQVSSGNTYFSTCNNTPHHWCDNLAQMLLEDYPKNPTVSRYVKAGCAGWLFLGGHETSTSVCDTNKDGITNPPAIPGNLGHKPEYADDDGGYLRLRGGNYYKKPYPILAKSTGKPAEPAGGPPVTSSSAPPRKSGDDLTMASMDKRLREAIQGDLRAKRTLRFTCKILGKEVELIALEEPGTAKVLSQGAQVILDWSDLTLQDRGSLAASRVREPESMDDLILACYFLLASGDRQAAEERLKHVPSPEADRIRGAFK